MEALSRDRHVRAFRATDAFAVEAYLLARTIDATAHRGLVDDIRRSAVRSGGALVAASTKIPGGDGERRLLDLARTALMETRYYIYLARRIGLLDSRRYRGLTARQDSALRELDALLQPAAQALERVAP